MVYPRTKPVNVTESLKSTDELLYECPEANSSVSPLLPWKLMVVDDDPFVHRSTKVALKYFSFENKGISFVSAYSAKEAKELMVTHPDTALILLDEVMETEDAGLQVASYIRNELKNKAVRIILRTGQPDRVPKESAVVDYDINGYKTKLELTQEQLFTTLVSGFRAYRDLKTLEQSQVALAKLNAELTDLNHNLEQLVCERTQQLVREIEERKKAEKALKLYVHALTHDLRSPVAGMENVIKNLLKSRRIDVPIQSGPEQNGLVPNVMIPVSTLERITDGCDRQLRMIDSMLNTHAIERLGVELQCQPVLLDSLISDVLTDWQLELSASRVTVINEVEPTLPPVDGDYYQLWRVFDNLISNAIKYSPPDFTLTVCAKLQPDSRQMICTIQDDGSGIDIDLEGDLFELYHRGETVKPSQGLGLGLYICRRIVEAHNGCIGVNSKLKKGTTVWFTLPVSVPTST